jgi:Zn-dependent protease
MSESPASQCPHCSALLPPGAIVCPACHRLVYQHRLGVLLQEAQRLEAVDPLQAAQVWVQCLPLLPPESPEYQQIGQRITALTSSGPHRLDYAPAPVKRETWQTAIAKTGGSMLVCMFIYKQSWGAPFAVGFVLLILIHELGHSIANWCYGIAQSPPIFLPYVGAVIMLRQNPPDAKAEAVIGIAGPIAGTFGALCCYGLFLYTRNGLYEQLSLFAFWMNLFNLIPIWPLDGGRIAAGITPVLWLAGVAIFAGVMLKIGGFRSPITLLVMFWALQNTLPRIRNVIFRGGMRDIYYRIGAPSRLAITFSYALLAGILLRAAAPLLHQWFGLAG